MVMWNQIGESFWGVPEEEKGGVPKQKCQQENQVACLPTDGDASATL